MAEEGFEYYCTNTRSQRAGWGGLTLYPGDSTGLSGGGDPRRTPRPWPGQVSLSLGPPPGVLHLRVLTVGEGLEAKDASSTLPGPEIPGKLNLIMT